MGTSKQQKEIGWLKKQLKEAKVILNEVLNQKYQNCLDRLVLANQNNCELRKEINQLITDKIELIETAENAERRECYLKEYVIRIKAHVSECNSNQSLNYLKLVETVKKSLNNTRTTLKEITRHHFPDDRLLPDGVCAKLSSNNNGKNSEEEYAECITVKQEPAEAMDEPIVLIKEEPDVSSDSDSYLICPTDSIVTNLDKEPNLHGEVEDVTHQLVGESFTRFNLILEKLRLGCRYVMILHREIKDLDDSLSRLSLLPPDWTGRQKISSWLSTMYEIQANDELDESQARQLSLDLETSYNDLNIMVQLN